MTGECAALSGPIRLQTSSGLLRRRGPAWWEHWSSRPSARPSLYAVVRRLAQRDLSLINAAITLNHQLDQGPGFNPIQQVNIRGAR